MSLRWGFFSECEYKKKRTKKQLSFSPLWLNASSHSTRLRLWLHPCRATCKYCLFILKNPNEN